MTTETIHNVRITTLVENSSSRPDILAEHGLSFWIELGERRILFDTGQSDAVIENSAALGIDLSTADAIVLSHGHYDHAGGLASVLEIAKNASVYVHPGAVVDRFSQRSAGAKPIGMSEAAKRALLSRGVIWTEKPVQIFPGVTVTGQVPRLNDFEDTGGAFFLDRDCRQADDIPDDQSLLIESSRGLIVVLGCAHAGVVNILDYSAKLSGKGCIYAVMGGMHLLRASDERVNRTIEAFERYGIERIAPVHCTGEAAVERIKRAFSKQYFASPAGVETIF